MTAGERDFKEGIAREAARERRARRILGVCAGDGPAVITRAFWLLALRHHPDKAPGDPNAERNFRNIANAYDYLVKGARRGVVLEEADPRPGGGEKAGHGWRYFLWWRDRYGGERTAARPGGEDAAALYEAWYSSPAGAGIDAEEKAVIAKLLGPGRGARLIEVGCGTGHFAGWLAARGYTVFGVDIRLDFLRFAARAAKGAFAAADGAAIPFADGAFDTAAAITALEFAASPSALLREMRRVSSRRILLMMLNPDSRLNWRRRRLGLGAFASANFWTHDEAVRLVKGSIPGAPGDSIRGEVREDFHALLLEFTG
mgnify:FL=1